MAQGQIVEHWVKIEFSSKSHRDTAFIFAQIHSNHGRSPDLTIISYSASIVVVWKSHIIFVIDYSSVELRE